ncbi:MAG: DUF6240 domain-containing protein [Lachnospiraceae bacterium]
MKVEFGTQGINQNVDKEKIAYGTHGQKDSARIAEQAAGYTLDISGTVMDNAAYGKEELHSVKDLMQDAGQQDVALQRDYMAVMSNSMSTEDFAELQREGYSPGNMEIETQVTILDEIKVTLAESGIVVEGYNDDLSKEELTEIAGSTGRASQIEDTLKKKDLPVTEETVRQINELWKQAENLKPLSDDAVKYMINNELEPTIENLYKAEYSTGNEGCRQARGYYQDGAGYYAKKAETLDWEQLREQAVNIIRGAGLRADEKTMDNARWAIENGIPLTGETITRLEELRSLPLPADDASILNAMVKAVSDGGTPQEASLAQSESIVEKAAVLIEDTENISDEAIKETVTRNEELTLRNLLKNEDRVKEQGSTAQVFSENETDSTFLSAKRLLEETRLRMTVEANLRLLRKGFSVDTTSLEKLVEELKAAEQEYYRPLLAGRDSSGSAAQESILSDKISLYKNTKNVLEQIRTVPAAVLGKLGTSEESLTLSDVYEEGTALKSTYEKAGRTYEALMTAPRADMGDSIKKAFQNIDTLLEEMGLEENEANRRAVRILGYSKTEINRETVEAVRSADQAVTRVIEKMTPAKTLQMIKDGDNPLEENIYELSEQLSKKDAEEEAEKYSKFLWKLEKNDEITEQERMSFLGIYRLFRQIEKSEGKLVGNVLNSGEPLTLKNLLSASRSNRASGMDISVDDSFGGLTELVQRGESISEQIRIGFQAGSESSAKDHRQQYYSSLAGEVLDKMTPESLQQSELSANTTLEALAEDMRQLDGRQQSDREYLQEQLMDIREAAKVEEDVIKALQTSGQPVTVNNLLAANSLMNTGGSLFEKLMKQTQNGKDSRKEKLEKAMESIQNGLTSREEAEFAYGELETFTKELLSENIQNAASSVDVKEMRLLSKQLSVAAGFARDENYEVPVQIDGEWTSINLKIIRNSEESGKVTASMKTERYGNIEAEFEVHNKQVSGFISGDQAEGLEKLEMKSGAFETALAGDGRTVNGLQFFKTGASDSQQLTKDKSDQDITAPMKELYDVAKAFITVLQQKGEEGI